MQRNNPNDWSFQQELKKELEQFLWAEQERFPEHETLKIDLHCHDHNSDVPDELLGRILNVPETWLPTEKLIKTLRKSGTDVITITNHNNARSCYELKDKGFDVLVGTEFSCTVPDFNIGIHVLTYGFTPDQEYTLNKLRKNVYQFLQYAHEKNIPTIWAHPLYNYSIDGMPPMDFFYKMAVVFERFEVLNGQRDTWQNMLVKSWVEGLTPELLNDYAKKFQIDPLLYSQNPYKKSWSGGSDSHMGIFTGQTGTLLHVPDLKNRLQFSTGSELALEAIRNGNMAPYGSHQNFEKLTIAFLDYVCQIAMYKQDPGLLRILLHKGTSRDKTIALLASNAFTELQNHKVTMRFIELFHECFMGKVPKAYRRMMVPKAYKPIFDEATNIAKARELPPQLMVKELSKSVNTISDQLNEVLYKRLSKKIEKLSEDSSLKKMDLNQLIEKLELPSDVRVLIGQGPKYANQKTKRISTLNLSEFLDGLSFPFLASSLILGANFTSAKVLYNTRPLLETFSIKLGKFRHPKRMLWLTDTYADKNGVSHVLQEIHKEIKRLNLPIDILVCSNQVQPDDHLVVLKPMAEFTLPFYEQQPVRIPNFNEIHHLFLENEYDRVMCSTEGIMGAAALYLRHAYNVPASFYIHTDWVMFARKVLNMDQHNLNRVRRLLRAYYGAFDQVFVLNSDHQKWLTGKEMGFSPDKVKLTAHWVQSTFKPVPSSKYAAFGLSETDKVVLFAGRISLEKGIMDIPEIFQNLKEIHPDIKMVFAGTGPAQNEIQKLMPDAIFLGWIETKELPYYYSAADLLILPSRFDTFSLVVLESLSCGLPVIAYKSKGPKDIIEHQVSGYLASSKNDMVLWMNEYFSNTAKPAAFKQAAIERAAKYSRDHIMKQL
ncbi:MAG: glycosyltransferase, partial [Salinivirgaceae bacterium]|nr:glycosyltransferase [Salinivirgaceae bacterium]